MSAFVVIAPSDRVLTPVVFLGTAGWIAPTDRDAAAARFITQDRPPAAEHEGQAIVRANRPNLLLDQGKR